MKQAEANVQSARINLGFTDVVSPIDGRAGQQQVTEGALVGQSDTTLLTQVDQIDKVYVNFSVSVADLDAMRRAAANGAATLSPTDKATVRIQLPDGSDYGEQGHARLLVGHGESADRHGEPARAARTTPTCACCRASS